MKKINPIVLGLLLVLAAIATSCATGYGPAGMTGGYRDSKIDDSTYLVSFDGNGYAQSEQVWSFWIYRCAELTKAKGYTNFTLALAPDKTGAVKLDFGARLAEAQRDNQPGFIKTSGHVRTTYIYIPGRTITTWHSKAIVKMFNDEPPQGVVTAISAQKILDQLHDYVQSGAKLPALNREAVTEQATVVVSFAPLRGV